MKPIDEDPSADSILARASAYCSPEGFTLAPRRLQELFLAGVAGYVTENRQRIILTTEMPGTDNPGWLLVAVTQGIRIEAALPDATLARIRRGSGGGYPERFAVRLLGAAAVAAFDRLESVASLVPDLEGESRRLCWLGALLAARCVLVREVLPQALATKGLAGRMLFAALSEDNESWEAILPALKRFGRQQAWDEPSIADKLGVAAEALLKAANDLVASTPHTDELPAPVARLLTLHSRAAGATLTAVRNQLISAGRSRTRRAAEDAFSYVAPWTELGEKPNEEEGRPHTKLVTPHVPPEMDRPPTPGERLAELFELHRVPPRVRQALIDYASDPETPTLQLAATRHGLNEKTLRRWKDRVSRPA